MPFHDAAQLQPLQLRGSFAFTGRLLLVGLLLDRRRISSRARPVPRNQSLACAAARRRARSDRCRLGHGHRAQPSFPVRVRRIMNVESGLNDGLTTQVVLFAIAATAGGRPEDAVLFGDRGKDSPAIKGNERPGVDLGRDQEKTSLVDSKPATAGKLLIPTLNDQVGAPRKPLPRVLALLRAAARRGAERCFGVVALFDTASCRILG